MEKKAEEILKKYSNKIRTVLMENNLLDYNYDLNLTVGRYKLNFIRRFDINDQINKIPLEVFNLLNECLIQFQHLWEDEGDGKEFFEDYPTNTLSLTIDIEAETLNTEIVNDINESIKKKKIELEKAIEDEEFEKAARIRNKLKTLNNKI